MFRNRISLFITLFIIFISINTITRTLLLVSSLQLIDFHFINFIKIYVVGLFFDVITFLYFGLPFLCLIIFIPDRLFSKKIVILITNFVFFIMIFLLIFISFAEYFFFNEFGVRFNFIAVDYLIYTHEVINNIIESYPFFKIVGIISVVSFVILYYVKKKFYFNGITFTNKMKFLSVYLILLILSVFFVDLDFKKISENSYVNELSANGIYSFFSAFKNNKIDYNKFYLTKNTETAFSELRSLLKESNNSFVNNNLFNLSREIRGKGGEKRLNVVVIVEESLGSEYLGILGNIYGLTPNIDELAKKSLFFTNIYATGTRTDRGLEAINLSIPPTPGRSIIKRPNNAGLFTWGYVMKRKNYDTFFIYGGYSYFDNMKEFFSSNGYKIIDRSDFNKDEVIFENAWGVCDEDTFNKSLKIFDNSYKNKKKFFAVIMTTSNHRPYTYPNGRISKPSHSGREGAVQYADYALGKFIKDAENHEWFNETVFVIVADHCASSAGKVALPINKYRIPFLIYSPNNIKPARIDKLSSQIDVAPTVLGILNFNYETKFFGKDILKMDKENERAFVSNYQKLGYIKSDKLVILDLKKVAKTYKVDFSNNYEYLTENDQKLIGEAVTYYQTASYLYEKNLYKP